MRIGICDDEKCIRDLIESKIKKHYLNADIVFFSSGEELLSSDISIGVLFLDIQMSGRNGMEIARELRRKGEKTIIIFVTAIEEYVYQAFDVGAFHYLVKPIDDVKFASVLHRAIEEWNSKNNGVKEAEDKYVMINNSGVHS